MPRLSAECTVTVALGQSQGSSGGVTSMHRLAPVVSVHDMVKRPVASAHDIIRRPLVSAHDIMKHLVTSVHDIMKHPVVSS